MGGMHGRGEVRRVFELGLVRGFREERLEGEVGFDESFFEFSFRLTRIGVYAKASFSFGDRCLLLFIACFFVLIISSLFFILIVGLHSGLLNIVAFSLLRVNLFGASFR